MPAKDPSNSCEHHLNIQSTESPRQPHVHPAATSSPATVQLGPHPSLTSVKPRSRFSAYVSPPPLQPDPSNHLESPCILRKSDDDQDPFCKSFSLHNHHHQHHGHPRCSKWTALIESSLLVATFSVLIFTLSLHPLRNRLVLSLLLWKWVLLTLLLLSGRRISVFIDRTVIWLLNCYFDVRKSSVPIHCIFQARFAPGIGLCMWAILLVLYWKIMTKTAAREYHYHSLPRIINRILATILWSSLIWAVKTVVFRWMVSSFYKRLFFKWVKDIIYYRDVIRVLDGPKIGSCECEDDERPALRKKEEEEELAAARQLVRMIDDSTQLKDRLTDDEFDSHRAKQLFQHVSEPADPDSHK